MGMTDEQKGYVYMLMHAVQFALQPIFTKVFISDVCNTFTLVLVCELMKVAISGGLLLASGDFKSATKGGSAVGTPLALANRQTWPTPAAVLAVHIIAFSTVFARRCVPVCAALLAQQAVTCVLLLTWR